MIAALVPVKAFVRSKKRLAGLVPAPERQVLVQAMFRDVLEVLAGTPGLDRVFVVTADPDAAALAEDGGAAVLWEAEQRSESRSVDWGATECRRMGFPSILVIPADVPLVTRQDLQALLALEREKPGVVLVPNRDATGTNGLLRTPPDVIPSRFGFDSFVAHQAEARRAGVPCAVLHLPNLALDVDEPEDLALVTARPVGAWTRGALARLGGLVCLPGQAHV